ncbi:hypothetical protein [Marinimicrobium sp. ABcell2]|uniref:hypothetical protein n=1 Tax=Marinimicrobium sp. ABcell2 TaxID=3069751 RepID=UPI0027B09B14|nr:hypothetical protein [Marinimicrobium sp. ABcell2]MDQ2075770.1 hypothetical protein [Marinimicrobium sp. ABcell2]
MAQDKKGEYIKTVGSGITAREYKVSEEDGSFREVYDSEWPQLFMFDIPPGLEGGTARIWSVPHPDDIYQFLWSVVEEAGLPTHEEPVIWFEDGNWEEVPEEIRDTCHAALSYKSTDQQWIEWGAWWAAYTENAQGIDGVGDIFSAVGNLILCDSPAGYALRLLGKLPGDVELDRIISGHWRIGPGDDLWRLYLKGVEFGMLYSEAINKFKWESHSLTGKKIRDKGREGHERAHGTQEEKARKWGAYQQKLNDILSNNPSLSYERAASLTAKHFNVSTRTIKRRTKNPQK